ncbi:MAG: PhzF family phenazine biosynthesis protein [Pseudomonadota bacterium]
MRRFAFHTLDVFTNKPLSGNALAVVHDADSLDTEEMQEIAREICPSETVFILAPHNPVHTARIRIFTPSRELPFSGHPTIGAAVLLAEQKFPRTQKHEAIIVLEEHIGAIRCGVQIDPDYPTIAEFDAPKLAQESGNPPPRDRLALTLGLMPADIGFENHKPTRFNVGIDYVSVPVRDRDALLRVRPMAPLWNDTIGAAAYIYTRMPDGGPSKFRARVFSPDKDLREDSATGAGAVVFAGALARYEGMADGTHNFSIEQGVEMGRPSRLQLEVEISAGRLTGTRIGGQAVIVSEGHIKI